MKRALPCLYHHVDPTSTATEPITKPTDITDSAVIRPVKESITVESKGAEAIDLTDPASALLTALSPAKAAIAFAPSSASKAVQGQGQGQVGSTTKRKRITPTVVGMLGSNTHLLSGNMLTASPTPTPTDVNNSNSSSNSSSSSGSGHSNGREGEEGVGSDGVTVPMPVRAPHPSADSSATTIPTTTAHSPVSHGQIAFPAISLPASNALRATGPDGTEIKKVRLTRTTLFLICPERMCFSLSSSIFTLTHSSTSFLFLSLFSPLTPSYPFLFFPFLLLFAFPHRRKSALLLC